MDTERIPAGQPMAAGEKTTTPAAAGPVPIYFGAVPTTSAAPRRCAYVVPLWGGERYVPGALVLAESLRRVGARHELVCLVTPEVPDSALRLAFDRVLRVEPIRHASRRFTPPQQAALYNHWIDESYTKWRALGLVEYARVLVVDADLLFLANCDDLFELAPPAACFSMPWAETRVAGGLRSPYAPSLPHGARVPAGAILSALGRPADARPSGPSAGAARPGFVGCSWTALLEPSAERLADLLSLLATAPVYGAGYTSVNGPDEIALAEMYAGRGVDFTHIHPRYAAIPWHPDWVNRDCRALHYHGGAKPWQQARDAWEDLAPWWRDADSFLFRHPELRGLFEMPTGPRAPIEPARAPREPEPIESAPAECIPVRAPASRLAVELARLELASRLLDLFQTFLSRPPSRVAKRAEVARNEARNAQERWAISLANAAPSPGQVYGVALVAAGAAANAKLVGELADLCRPGSTEAAKECLSRARSLIRSAAPSVPGTPLASVVGGWLVSGSRRLAPAPVGGRVARLVELGGPTLTAEMVLRYESLVPGGSQWAVPRAHVHHLYEAHGVRNEGFASPLNANLLGLEGAGYCSLFPDIDAAFGSMGSFFAADLFRGGAWIVNPPFIESLMELAVAKILGALSAAGDRSLTVFLVLPAWVDSRAYSAVESSKFVVAARDLRPGEYSYEDAAGEAVPTRAHSRYYALTSSPAQSVEAFLDALDNWGAT